MAPFGKIYTYPNNGRVWKALAVAKLNGLEVVEAPDFQMGVTNKSPEFLAKFPMGKVPALETASGFCLSESTAIAQYLAESGPKKDQLLGSDPETRALIQQWICFTDGELLPNVAHFMICIFGMIPYEQAAWDQKLAALDRALKRMEVGLKGKKFLVGEQLTLADISAASALHFAFKTVIDAKWRESLPAVVDWFNNVLASEGPKDWPAAEFVDVAKRPGQ